MKFTNADAVIAHLYSLPHLHPKSDLSYIKKMLKQLGNPQDKVKTIHVTGTNGKGSTCYYLSNLLQKAGQKTGLFVSPYVREFNERIQLNGHDISDQALVSLANQVEAALAQLRLRDDAFSLVTFEYETVMAFLYFAEEQCDYAVIEVGIGGEHDKTNVITPAVSIITTVGLDHERIIGPTLQDIAREKSGVIKTGRPVVLGNVPQAVLPLLLTRARILKAPVLLLDRNFTVVANSKIIYRYHHWQLSFALRPAVEGYDIAIAVTAFLQLHLPLKGEQITAAINQTAVPGRYQFVNQTPAIILDGAHNIQAMTNLLTFVHRLQAKRGGQVKVLITMMKDKDLKQVFQLFKPQDQITLTTLPYPRTAKKADFPAVVTARFPYLQDWHQAFLSLKASLGAKDILLVTGSFYLVGAVLNVEDH